MVVFINQERKLADPAIASYDACSPQQFQALLTLWNPKTLISRKYAFGEETSLTYSQTLNRYDV